MQLGLVSGGKITELGKHVSNIGSNDVMSSLALVLSKLHNCSHEMIKIVSMVELCNNNIVNFFNAPKQHTTTDGNFKKLYEKYNSARRKLRHKTGDHLTLLNIYIKFYEQYTKYKGKSDMMEKLNAWCYDRFLKLNLLMKANDRVKKLQQRLYGVKLEGLQVDKQIIELPPEDRINMCLMNAYIINTANRTNSYYNTLTDVRTVIDQNSFLEFGNPPKIVYYNELFISNGKPAINIVSAYTK
jgi:HrpA-like RNA helicase